MKTTLLKMFRKRFDVIRFGENSWALADHKDQRVIYKKIGSEIPLINQIDAIYQGVCIMLSMYEFQKFITTRRKRIYRSTILKRS